MPYTAVGQWEDGQFEVYAANEWLILTDKQHFQKLIQKNSGSSAKYQTSYPTKTFHAYYFCGSNMDQSRNQK